MEAYPLAERKLVYRLLHAQLVDHPELMEGDFLMDLQKSLQRMARAEGVDVADHGAWDEWLGNRRVSCAARVAGRVVID